MNELDVKSIIVYKHEEKEYVKLHSHGLYECVFYVTGKGSVKSKGESFNFSSSTLLITPPEKEHDEYSELASDVYIVLFDLFTAKINDIVLFKIDEKSSVRVNALFKKMIEVYDAKEENYKETLNSIFTTILKIADSQVKHNREVMDYFVLVRAVKKYIMDNLQETIDYQKLCSQFGYSYSRLRHIFSEYSGFSMHRYLMNCRLEYSKKLLQETKCSLDKIYKLCGFKNKIRFCLFFKKETGISPIKFREINKKEVDDGVVSFAKDKIKNFIIDTDLDADCDDVGAIAIANILCKRKFGKLLAITHCVGYKEALQNVAIINKYYGLNIPLGLYNGDYVVPFQNKFVSKVNAKFPCDFEYSDSIRLLRKQLAASEDKSVTLITLGQFNNVEKLRLSPPDDFSPLTGQELMEKKLDKIVSMAGLFLDNKETNKDCYDGREYNILTAKEDARSFIDNMTNIPIVFVDWFCGYDVITFQDYVMEFKDKKPVSYSYYLFSKGGRESWDLIATMYAFLPKSKAFRLVGPGKINIASDGSTSFDTSINHNHFYLRINNKQYVKNYLDTLIYEGEKYAKKNY
ncbi:MAG: helix-turn-helix domain-containing protein [Bacilli bacterium]